MEQRRRCLLCGGVTCCAGEAVRGCAVLPSAKARELVSTCGRLSFLAGALWGHPRFRLGETQSGRPTRLPSSCEHRRTVRRSVA